MGNVTMTGNDTVMMLTDWAKAISRGGGGIGGGTEESRHASSIR